MWAAGGPSPALDFSFRRARLGAWSRCPAPEMSASSLCWRCAAFPPGLEGCRQHLVDRRQRHLERDRRQRPLGRLRRAPSWRCLPGAGARFAEPEGAGPPSPAVAAGSISTGRRPLLAPPLSRRVAESDSNYLNVILETEYRFIDRFHTHRRLIVRQPTPDEHQRARWPMASRGYIDVMSVRRSGWYLERVVGPACGPRARGANQRRPYCSR